MKFDYLSSFKKFNSYEDKVKFYREMFSDSNDWLTLQSRIQSYLQNGTPKFLRDIGFLENLSNKAKVDSDGFKDLSKLPAYIRKPFRSIPDIRYFKVDLGSYDKLLGLFGIKRRGAPVLEFQKYNNKALNRYLDHQHLRMGKALDKGDQILYGKVAGFCMTRSISFFLVQLQDTELNGHRTLPLGKVRRIYREYYKIANSRSTKLNYKRVMIDKTDDRLRPLGVPELEGRIYMGLGQKFFQRVFQRHINPSQHAFLYGRGTLTAGREIFEKVIDKPNLGEFDLQGFFDNVWLDSMRIYLKEIGIPRGVRDYMFALNMRVPKDVELFNRFDPQNLMDVDQVTFDKLWMVTGNKQVGVPQGVPCSPLLSLSVLERFMFTRFDCVMYADDGIMGDDQVNKDKQLGPPRMCGGIKFAPSKCHLVKIDGRGIRPLKFLGLEYNGNTGTLMANTRNGSKLVYDKNQLIKLIEDRELVSGNSQGRTRKDSGISLITSSLYPLIISRMYNGSGTMSKIDQDFKLKYIKGSGMFHRRHGIERHKLNVFNSTSFALRSLGYILKRDKVKFVKPEMDPQTITVNRLGLDLGVPHMMIRDMKISELTD